MCANLTPPLDGTMLREVLTPLMRLRRPEGRALTWERGSSGNQWSCVVFSGVACAVVPELVLIQALPILLARGFCGIWLKYLWYPTAFSLRQPSSASTCSQKPSLSEAGTVVGSQPYAFKPQSA
eukprot:4755210-Amphidinium_carterae.1